MDTLFSYFKKWRLILSEKKTVSAFFHLNNKLADAMLDVYVEERPLPFAPVPTYLGVKMGLSLTYHHHLESLKMKVASRVALVRKLAGTTWGADAATLCISVLALVFSTAEYCAPVWCRSSHTHMHAGLWIESCHANHNSRLPQKHADPYAVCPWKCCTPTNTQRCSSLEICLESSSRPIELATWHNCNASQDLSRAAASNQKISQIELGPCAGCRAATIVEKALPMSCPNAFDESWRGLPCLSKSTQDNGWHLCLG